MLYAPARLPSGRVNFLRMFRFYGKALQKAFLVYRL